MANEDRERSLPSNFRPDDDEDERVHKPYRGEGEGRPEGRVSKEPAYRAADQAFLANPGSDEDPGAIREFTEWNRDRDDVGDFSPDTGQFDGGEIGEFTEWRYPDTAAAGDQDDPGEEREWLPQNFRDDDIEADVAPGEAGGFLSPNRPEGQVIKMTDSWEEAAEFPNLDEGGDAGYDWTRPEGDDPTMEAAEGDDESGYDIYFEPEG